VGHPKVADPPTADTALTDQYERLRQVALTGEADGWHHGLGVLATRGVTGWIAAHRTIPPAPRVPSPRTAVDHLRVGAGELVTVMAAMALAHLSPT
jgi:hypothetical protein